VRLTERGQHVVAQMDERSAEEVGALLDALPDPDTAIQAMRRLQRAIAPPAHRTVTLRGLQPGDLGWLVQRHGELYAREYGWDHTFEQLAAEIVATFNPTQDRAWIAEVDQTKAGVILCVHEDEATAKLRTLLVEPHARGLGVGRRLVQEVIRHAKNKHYATLRLWTNDSLTTARRIYEREGFTLEHEAPHRAFGHDLVEQTWSLNLRAWTETH
jgi:GNAT superfamily N-acetyltransferase